MDNELQQAFERELEALERSGATMPLRPAQAYKVLLVLQFAAQSKAAANGHPWLARDAQQLGCEIEGRLCKTPAMREVARQGWAAFQALDPAPPEPEPEPEPEEKPKKKRKR